MGSQSKSNNTKKLNKNLLKSKDICAKKHKGHQNSKEAYKYIRKSSATLRAKIIEFLKICGLIGATAYEISKFLNRPVHSISGRCSELKAIKKVKVIGKRLTPFKRRADVITINGGKE